MRRWRNWLLTSPFNMMRILIECSFQYDMARLQTAASSHSWGVRSAGQLLAKSRLSRIQLIQQLRDFGNTLKDSIDDNTDDPPMVPRRRGRPPGSKTNYFATIIRTVSTRSSNFFSSLDTQWLMLYFGISVVLVTCCLLGDWKSCVTFIHVLVWFCWNLLLIPFTFLPCNKNLVFMLRVLLVITKFGFFCRQSLSFNVEFQSS